MKDDKENLLEEFGFNTEIFTNTQHKILPDKPINVGDILNNIIGQSPEFKNLKKRLENNYHLILQRQRHCLLQRQQHYQLSAGPENILANELKIISINPSVIFRIEKIIMYESVPNSTHVDILVGSKKVISTPTSSFNHQVLPFTCPVGLSIHFSVKNNTNTIVKWQALLLGKTVR